MEHVEYRTDEQLDAYMHNRGLHCYREYFRWGKTPAYCDAAQNVFRFVDRGDVLTPSELLVRLLDEWCPAAQEDSDYAAYRMRRELEALDVASTKSEP